MKECEEYLEAMSMLLDGELEAEKKADLERHLAACGTCAEALRHWRQAAGEAQDVHEVGEDTWQTVWGKIEERTLRDRSVRRLRRDITKAFVAAAVAASVLLGAFWLTPETPVAANPAVEIVEMETGPEYTAFILTTDSSETPVIWLEEI